MMLLIYFWSTGFSQRPCCYCLPKVVAVCFFCSAGINFSVPRGDDHLMRQTVTSQQEKVFAWPKWFTTRWHGTLALCQFDLWPFSTFLLEFGVSFQYAASDMCISCHCLGHSAFYDDLRRELIVINTAVNRQSAWNLFLSPKPNLHTDRLTLGFVGQKTFSKSKKSSVFRVHRSGMQTFPSVESLEQGWGGLLHSFPPPFQTTAK